MKAILLPLLLCLTLSGFAQECKNYFFLQNNKTVEMTIYNKKGDPNGKQIYQVSDVKTNGGITSANLATDLLDKNGKSIGKGNSHIQCNNGVMMVDMKMLLPQQQSEQANKTDAKMENVFIEYPASLNINDKLKDANVVMEMESSGVKQSIRMDITDRKVEAKESVTTTAGTWDCFVISYKVKTVIKTMGIGMPINSETKEWYAPGFGVVKTESKNGGTAITAIK